MTNKKKPGIGTQAVWAGEEISLPWGSTQVPIMHSVSFGYDTMEEWLKAVSERKLGTYFYSRNNNPIARIFEEKIGILEGAEGALAFSTGMAAVTAVLFHMLSPGDRVVSLKDTYGGTSKLFLEFLPRFKIDAKLCETTDHIELEREIARGCKLVYLETPTNPTMKIVDIARLAKAAHKVGAKVAVDNTFATPINQKPLAMGADIVIHSATKYLGGHADAMGGVVCGTKSYTKELYHFREITGAIIQAFQAYFMIRSMKTLHVRVKYQNESAMKVAKFLSRHPRIEKVLYPGLPTHENHLIARKQMRGFGGMLSFVPKGGSRNAYRVINRLRYGNLAANLGAVETIVAMPSVSSHAECTKEEREALGIPDGLIRYSVGLEDTNDLIDDLKHALR